MKKLLILILCLISVSVYPQLLKFTVVGEPQISWMVPDKENITRDGSVLGLNAGMLLDVFFAENYAFATGLTISNLGGRLCYEDRLIYKTGTGRDTIPSYSTITYKLQYLSIPLGLKFKTNEIGYLTYTANLGLNPMINIRARGTDISGTLEKDVISEEIRLININYFILIGAEYSLGGSTALSGGLGYSAGMTDVTTRAFDKIKLGAIMIRIGIRF